MKNVSSIPGAAKFGQTCVCGGGRGVNLPQFSDIIILNIKKRLFIKKMITSSMKTNTSAIIYIRSMFFSK